MSRFHSDGAVAATMPGPTVVRQQRRANLSAPWKRTPYSGAALSFHSQAHTSTVATTSLRRPLFARGCNEPHFHGGGDTSSFRRREATEEMVRTLSTSAAAIPPGSPDGQVEFPSSSQPRIPREHPCETRSYARNGRV